MTCRHYSHLHRKALGFKARLGWLKPLHTESSAAPTSTLYSNTVELNAGDISMALPLRSTKFRALRSALLDGAR